MPDIVKVLTNGDLIKIAPRTLLEIAGILVAIVLWLTGGFSKSEVTAHDLTALTQAQAALTVTIHDMNRDGTSHSAQKDALQDQQLAAHEKRIEQNEKNYQALYD